MGDGEGGTTKDIEIPTLLKSMYVSRKTTTSCIPPGTFFGLLGLSFTSSVKIACPASAELGTTGRSQPVMVRLRGLCKCKD